MDPVAEQRLTQIEQQLRQLLQPVSRPRLVAGGGGGSGASKLVQTPGGGIAARSGTTLTSGTCSVYYNASGTATDSGDDITVINPWPFALPASFYLIAVQDTNGDWYALHPGIVDVQWDDPDLEQTLDGSTYTNIDTAVDCT